MPPDPISPYGVAKLAAERYCISFSRVYESFETVVLRYFNVFGPRQSPSSQYAAVVPLFLTAIANGNPITIHGDGEQSRDFTYVANVVDATMRAADVQEANGRIFNVAAGSPASVRRRPFDRQDPRQRAGDAVCPGRGPATSATRGPTSARRARPRLRDVGRARGRPAPDGRGADWLGTHCTTKPDAMSSNRIRVVE
jgi:hypothetical protein